MGICREGKGVLRRSKRRQYLPKILIFKKFRHIFETDRPTDRQTDRPTDRQTDRPTDRQTDRPTDR